MKHADFAVIGLGVMGLGLAENLARNGVRVAGFDLDADRRATLARLGERTDGITTAATLSDLVATLSVPRQILLMVPAGTPVDRAIADLRPLLSAGDCIIDGGNSHFLETERRHQGLVADKIHFFGMGVSGGEAGARNGPALMPGGDRAAFDKMEPILKKVAAKAAEDGEPCVSYIGAKGAGHFVKMVHNGIEYAEMQLLAEIYYLLTRVYGQPARTIGEIFEGWNQGEDRSYLLGVSAAVLQKDDPETGLAAVDIILDRAGQKGTGKWTTQTALDLGAGVPSITAALDARILSSMTTARSALSASFESPPLDPLPLDAEILTRMRDSLLVGRIIGFAQGLEMMKTASEDHQFGLDLPAIARGWRAGCILASPLLDHIAGAIEGTDDFVHLLALPWFKAQLEDKLPSLKQMILAGLAADLPLPVMTASKGYVDSLRQTRLSANLIQGQRDYFGAHGFERTDQAGSHHLAW
ncbi:NADP-dependent phosphogluconate dehydrogenase [Cohaesibacter sp. CAU 1516]|uniref:NADP-dependent phosphogluconate dehydrogenase n=1 Tax=Cohaesibacter sp. CAU 1516 TaxID=2576038 RepID=UPI0010FE259D|nr:NADP-dependent phosphogluconate dehydrogenase [Cohaesibacter sp. CAU 1516]TLP46094.1 NADP-dependent phosphogluconate dehydrogenase [Cohaesibacter sp. CAU 1516]